MAESLAQAEAAVAANDHKSVIEVSFREVWNGGKWSPLAEVLYAPDLIIHFVNLPQPPRVGPEDFRGLETMVRTTFPDWHMTLERMVREGPLVACQINATGTQLGEFRGFPPTGNRIDVREFGLNSVDRRPPLRKADSCWGSSRVSGAATPRPVS